MGRHGSGWVVLPGQCEFRLVQLGWEHPRGQSAYADGSPRYRPLLSRASLLARMQDAAEEGEIDLDDYMPPVPEGAPFGYALYETVTEGTPVSPVFGTLELLALWCEGGATRGGVRLTRGQWLEEFRRQQARRLRCHAPEPEF
jgi:hypothetical protein